MNKAILIILIGSMACIAILLFSFPRSILPDDILSRYHGSHSCPALTEIYPADGTLFPPELPAPAFPVACVNCIAQKRASAHR